MASNEITEITRRAVLDFLSVTGTDWAGRLQEDEFLTRLYDLSGLPSHDHRHESAAGDIYQHRIAWRDWDDDWVFYDNRFNILHGSDENFVRFLAEMLHPAVRGADKAAELAEEFNRHLQQDGWSLVEAKRISGRVVYAPARGGVRAAAFEEPTGWEKVDRQLQEARSRLASGKTEEHFQAVGLLCRETLISLGQHVFDADKHKTVDGVAASSTDAGRMLEAFFAHALGGGSNEEARAHGKAALKLALALQHRRSADFRMAALSVEATSSVVNLAAILAGRRG